MNGFYKEIVPEDRYKPYIQKFWILDNLGNPLTIPAGYALPNGCCTIVFITGNGVLLNLAGRAIELPAGVYLSGQITKRTSISLKPHSKAIMAQVKPWLPPIMTDMSMHELVDNIVGLDAINPFQNQLLTDIELADERSVILALYKVLDAFMHVDVDAYFIQWAYKRLSEGTSQVNIADIASASGYSQRRVEQKFKTLIGLTPKEIQSILQLRKLIDDLSNPIYNRQLGALALQHGYYDQSHFIRSYQRIIAEAPSQFNVNEYLLPINGHFDFLQL